MSKILYAIDIDVRNSSPGWVFDPEESWSDTSLGLDDGHLYLITDAPDLDGSKTCLDMSDPESPVSLYRQIWYQGVLSKEGIENTSPEYAKKFKEYHDLILKGGK